jgi:plasmid stabilization system protein ParE
MNPIYSTIFLKKAKKELIDAWNWYEDKQIGLGDKFIKEAFQHISILKNNPINFPSYYKPYRQLPLSIFPYLIIYKVVKSKIIIVSIFHTSRNPSRKIN